MTTTPTDVDRSAPVLAHHGIDVAAPPATVWEMHTDVDGWASWNPDITEAHLDGAFEPGSSFDWSSYGFAVTSTIYAVDPRSRILWGGTAGGITGVHEWRFTETPSGTQVETTESFAGAPVEADVAGMQSLLDGSLAAWLGRLKAAAEARA